MIVPVILGGGVGSRLWPLSRSAFPKQYNSFFSDLSLFQETLSRAEKFSNRSFIVCGEQHRFIVAEQLQSLDIHEAKVLLEPVRRDTAPAAALTAHYFLSQGEDSLLLILPADHVIENVDVFVSAVLNAQEYAENGKLVTFGCHPNKPSTAYGYLKKGECISEKNIYSVSCFSEKPDIDQARKFIASGDYYWNCGIFLFRASAFLQELQQYSPSIYQYSKEAMTSVHKDGIFLRPEKQPFIDCPSNSIDYAVMEKTTEAVVVSIDMGWSDVGSWDSLQERLPKDDNGNTMTGDVYMDGVKDSYIRASNRMVVALGIENQVIVETRDAVLVADKSKSEDIKRLVQQLENEKRSETQLHSKVYRPWGSYETLELGARFQVKCITVKPGASLSLQMHHRRSEHWVVISGTAEVMRGNDVFQLNRDQSTYIPTKTKHRLTNIGDDTLEIIEVQVGDYLGEDDIVRFEDNYGRIEETAEAGLV